MLGRSESYRHLTILREEPVGNHLNNRHLEEPVMQLTVRDLMSLPVSVSVDRSMEHTLEKMLDEGVGEIYVTGTDGRLKGLVPDYEILKAMVNKDDLALTVQKAMNVNFLTVNPADSIETLISIFRNGSYQRVAVVENGRLVGQIHRRDVLRTLFTMKHWENEPQTSDIEESESVERKQPPQPRFLKSKSATQTFVAHYDSTDYDVIFPTN